MILRILIQNLKKKSENIFSVKTYIKEGRYSQKILNFMKKINQPIKERESFDFPSSTLWKNDILFIL